MRKKQTRERKARKKIKIINDFKLFTIKMKCHCNESLGLSMQDDFHDVDDNFIAFYET